MKELRTTNARRWSLWAAHLEAHGYVGQVHTQTRWIEILSRMFCTSAASVRWIYEDARDHQVFREVPPSLADLKFPDSNTASSKYVLADPWRYRPPPQVNENGWAALDLLTPPRAIAAE